MCLGGVAFDQVVGELELDRERDELLLRPVVDVALEPATALVLRGDQPASAAPSDRRTVTLSSSVRRTLRSTRPACAARSRDQLLVGRRHRIARRLADRERAEQLARLTRPGTTRSMPGDRGDRARVGSAIGAGDVDVLRATTATSAELLVDGEPDVAPARRRSPRRGSAPCAAARRLVGVRVADAIGELRQDLVRRRPLAVDDPVREARRDVARAGWNVTATITAASIVRNESPRPSQAPSTTTRAR